MKILPNDVAVIDGDKLHAEWCAAHGLVHDEFSAGIIRNLIQSYGCKTCIDAGANIGTLTKVMLDAGCRVIAFEVNPEAVECLKHNCNSEDLEICAFALGDENDEIELIKNKNNAGASWCASGSGLPVCRLDDVLAIRVELVDFIKVDIEGFEVKFLLGAKNLINQSRPVMFIEVNIGALQRQGHTVNDLRQVLHDLKYDVKIAQPFCNWNSLQYDVICIPLA